MLTKEQIAKLSSDQQETLADLELRRAQHRQKLLLAARDAHKSWLGNWRIFVSLLAVFAMFFAILGSIRHSPTNLMFSLVGTSVVNSLALSYITGANRRIDAIVEILSEDGVLDPFPRETPSSETFK